VDTDAPSRLQRSQDARRARVIECVLDLLREGGYDAVRLRTVWERTGVGTDTIYRYFSSRERLISSAIGVWLDREFFAPAPTWRSGATPAEQLLALSRGTWDVWERAPWMLEPFVRAALADDGAEDGLAARSLRVFEPLLAAALEPVDPEYRDDVLLVVNSVTHSAMTSVVRGQLGVDEVYPMVERTIRRLAQHPAMDGLRPDAWDYDARTATHAPA
jgi:TetR/AcrR family transcriptional regulator, cholesterol catabolism regulator